MKQFLKKTVLFLCIPMAVMLIGLLLPPTPRAEQSLLLVAPIKDSMLQHVKQPRIILVSGSSMGFGLVSQIVKDSLHRNPINTGIHGGMGLYYLLDNTAQYIQKGDIVVLAPEYHQFFGDFCEGNEELLRVYFDNKNGLDFFKLRAVQLKKTYPYIPRYAMSKFIPSQYFNLKTQEFYSKRAFNEYGDVNQHWGQTWPNPVVFEKIDGDYLNTDVLQAVVEFNELVKSKGATLYFTFPGYLEHSFGVGKPQIKEFEAALRKTNLTILGTPEQYIMTPDLIFDTPYHLTKEGATKRTQLLVKDLKTQMQKDHLE
ncbi:hypothetical protein [Flavobacterium caeni]|uniref:Uncharacterized protein n=1 Tax=Flavobacterium caeni TaxID=490189 RepID=A0A1G5AW21_9FLAO|nr:hypothetical protein [Flavobacterium caeni]SCX82041.1 hypothetical protein SAMN02927903_00172 [Flavobacterium caeni]